MREKAAEDIRICAAEGSSGGRGTITRDRAPVPRDCGGGELSLASGSSSWARAIARRCGCGQARRPRQSSAPAFAGYLGAAARMTPRPRASRRERDDGAHRWKTRSASVPFPTFVSFAAPAFTNVGNKGTLASHDPSVPIPKFAHPRGPLRCELRNQRDTSNFMILVRHLDLKFLNELRAIMIGTSNPPH